MESLMRFFKKARPFLAMIFIQISYALMSIAAKFALNTGMSPHVLVVYRMAFATLLIAPFAIVLERHSRPKMTLTTFAKIALLSVFEPTLDHNMYYTGMKHTTAAFTSAMCNILPAMTFLMAFIFKYYSVFFFLRFEKVEIKKRHSQAKVAGTLVAVVGAMIMTLVKGNIINFQFPKLVIQNHQSYVYNAHNQDLAKGALMIVTGCFSWTCFIILQAMILKSYPAELSLTTFMCIMGMFEGSIIVFAVERNKTSVWSIHCKIELIASIYGGLVSGLAYYIIGWVSKERGPVFVSAFNPLNMVIIAILTPFVFSEKMYLGRVIGAIVIVIGIYMVLWGKKKDQNQNLSKKADQEMVMKKLDDDDNGESIARDAVKIEPCKEDSG